MPKTKHRKKYTPYNLEDAIAYLTAGNEWNMTKVRRKFKLSESTYYRWYRQLIRLGAFSKGITVEEYENQKIDKEVERNRKIARIEAKLRSSRRDPWMIDDDTPLPIFLMWCHQRVSATWGLEVIHKAVVEEYERALGLWRMFRQHCTTLLLAAEKKTAIAPQDIEELENILEYCELPLEDAKKVLGKIRDKVASDTKASPKWWEDLQSRNAAQPQWWEELRKKCG